MWTEITKKYLYCKYKGLDIDISEYAEGLYQWEIISGGGFIHEEGLSRSVEAAKISAIRAANNLEFIKD